MRSACGVYRYSATCTELRPGGIAIPKKGGGGGEVTLFSCYMRNKHLCNAYGRNAALYVLDNLSLTLMQERTINLYCQIKDIRDNLFTDKLNK